MNHISIWAIHKPYYHPMYSVQCTIHYPPNVQCTLYIVHLYTIQPLYSVHCTLIHLMYSVQCTLHYPAIVQCSLYTYTPNVQCTQYTYTPNVHCTVIYQMYIVQCTNEYTFNVQWQTYIHCTKEHIPIMQSKLHSKYNRIYIYIYTHNT